MSGVYVSYLTSADLTRVIGWMETVTWAIHSALKYTVYAKNKKYTIKWTNILIWNMKVMWLISSFAYQHTQGNTPQARWWSWCREINSVLQSRWSPRPHTYTSYRGWSLRTSCCPLYAPLLHTHNLRRKIKSLVKNYFLLRLQFTEIYLPLQRGQQAPASVSWCIQGSLGHSGDAQCTSPAYRHRQINIQTHRKCKYGGKRQRWEVRPGKCRWSTGLNSDSISSRHWTPVHQAYTLRPETDKDKNRFLNLVSFREI